MNQSTENVIEEQVISHSQIRRNILKLAWPIIVEMGLITLVEIADMIMVGKLGVNSLNAIGLTIQPLMLWLIIFNGLSVGTTALVARFIGERNGKLANRTFQQSLLGGIFLAFILSILLYFVAPTILFLMNAKTEKIVQLGTGYIRWLIPGLFFQCQFIIISSALRGAGDTKTPMFANVLINILNVTGNYLFIYGIGIFPQLGVYGAALASTIARITGFTVLMILLQKNRSILKIEWSKLLKVDWPILKRIIRIGAPAAGEQAALRIGQTLFARVVSSLGTVAFAAHTSSINAESISYLPGWGFSVAATTIVGQKLGEGKPKEAETSGIVSMKFGIAIMAFMGIIFLIFPEYLMRLYTDMSDPNAQEFIRLGARNLRIVAIAQIPMATQFVLAGALRGAGYTKPVLYSTVAGVWIGRLLFSYIFIFHLGWGLIGAWIAMNIDWFVRSSYVIFLWKKGEWKNVKV
ncbi:MAG: MATE family efflux transporter [Halanaerobiales bacterium]|nr:MATE family efflux transporter [Halanaerobiales bacterium]